MRFSAAAALALAFLLLACAPGRMPPGPGPTEPRLEPAALVTADGLSLPLRVWRPTDNPGHRFKAVVLALHGFNDYSNAFESPASWLAERGVVTYAYDQRGFGAGPSPGLWAGTDRLVGDVFTTIRLLRARHAGLPVFLLGESMGGAVATVAMARDEAPEVEGVILVAPAVWARETMPFHQRALLWIGERLIPWAKFTGQGLGYQASDNIEALRANGRDPLFIKETRVSAMGGLVDLMSEALEAGPRFRRRALVLYGEKDEIIPRPPTLRLWRSLPGAADGRQRRALYPKGWHMLLRDLEAEIVLADILAWIGDAEAPLPSAADRSALVRLGGLGEG